MSSFFIIVKILQCTCEFVNVTHEQFQLGENVVLVIHWSKVYEYN